MADPVQQAVRCEICPKTCLIRPGQSGECRIRVNVDGQLQSVTYGRPCAIHVDPIEKKPFFHYLPGTEALSLATVGCNLHCKNCQNWEISQANPEDMAAYSLSPSEIPALARKHDCLSVAYTYTEPIVFYEYTTDSSRVCKDAGLRNLIVTAGYINPDPVRKLSRVIHAATLDIKAMSDAFYRDVCGASLAPVLRGIDIMLEEGVFLELSNLVIPTLNDSDENFRDLCRWVREHAGAETPLHFLRFFPLYRMTHLPPTPADTLIRARDIAKAEGLKHVYVGNLDLPDGENTFCASCGHVVIRRSRHVVTENRLNHGACPDCGRALHGVWQ